MRLNLVSDLEQPRNARAERMLLREVLAEAWHERRRQPTGSGDRLFINVVVRDLVEQLRRLR